MSRLERAINLHRDAPLSSNAVPRRTRKPFRGSLDDPPAHPRCRRRRNRAAARGRSGPRPRTVRAHGRSPESRGRRRRFRGPAEERRQDRRAPRILEIPRSRSPGGLGHRGRPRADRGVRSRGSPNDRSRPSGARHRRRRLRHRARRRRRSPSPRTPRQGGGRVRKNSPPNPMAPPRTRSCDLPEISSRPSRSARGSSCPWALTR